MVYFLRKGQAGQFLRFRSIEIPGAGHVVRDSHSPWYTYRGGRSFAHLSRDVDDLQVEAQGLAGQRMVEVEEYRLVLDLCDRE